MIELQRVYDLKEQEPDGYTILVDRLWPRGIKKTELKPNEWIKEIAPSSSLRKWFGHDPERWKEFKKEYKNELKHQADLLKKIKELERHHKRIVLLFGAKDKEHNQAIVLKEVLDRTKF